MNKYKEYMAHLDDKNKILQTRYNKNCKDRYEMITEIVSIEERIDNLEIQIDDLEEIVETIQKYSNRQFVKQETKKLLIKNLIYFGLIGGLSTAAGFALTGLNSHFNILIYTIAGAIGITAAGYAVSNFIYDFKELLDNKKIAKENNLGDINKKINRTKKKLKKLEDTHERNNLKIITLNEKIEILRNAIQDFNNLKYKTERLYREALDYAKDVHGCIVHEAYQPKYYENTINQYFKDDEGIKDIMKRERKLENDN